MIQVEVAGKAINGGHIAKRGAREGTVSVESSRPDRCEGDNWLISLPFICFSFFFFVLSPSEQSNMLRESEEKKAGRATKQEAARDQTRRRNGPSNGGQRV
jgi:hypothetical protein